MKKKNLRFQAVDYIKHTTKELLAELVELSVKDLQQIVGGVASGGMGDWRDR